VSAFYGIVIYMHRREHPPPHFHAWYAEHKASIAIDTLVAVDGALPPRILRIVREWGFKHRPELLANWHRARAHEPLITIEPLP
jgi:Domain of unknown function (DUF4160)